ncbi:phytanoyl-CoA dioxygenase family protein [Actinophytocola sp.]|uniref:phytanoyl-CoA dioxygenase family protein n=1 Tax=Actinophytocola sp. TaxID=1872138 RepID=UPI002ED2A9D5
MTNTLSVVSEAQRKQYREEGWFVLERVLSDEQLELLRGFAETAMNRIDAEMDAAGVDVLDINHRGRRYFANGLAKTEPALRSFLFGDLMADICRATIGVNAYQFVEQYVIKGADKNSAFSWHQDSGYVHENHEPYLTCWIALDDVTEENGCVYLLPYSRAGIRTYVKHFDDATTNDKVGYIGTDPGVPIIAPAGSIACFSSVVFHRSGPNLTDRVRRVYLAQYSPEVIMNSDRTEPWQGFEPFLLDGEVVRQ